jgi:hypothetical protein
MKRKQLRSGKGFKVILLKTLNLYVPPAYTKSGDERSG